jgi:hypothetical protein
VYLRSGDSAYASYYGRGFQSLSALVAFWLLALIPFDLIVVPANIVWAIAVASFIVLAGLGWQRGLRHTESAVRARWLLLLATVIPFAGVIAYFPNPWYARFYSLPYLIGAALITGMAVTWLSERSPAGGRFALFAWIAFTFHAVSGASLLSEQTDAVQRRDSHIIAYIADSIPAEHVNLATTRAPPHEWLGIGSALNRMARAKGHPWPPTRNVNCEDALRDLTSQHGLVTVNLQSSCKFRASQQIVVSEGFRRLDLRRFRLVVDSAHADIVFTDAIPRSP